MSNFSIAYRGLQYAFVVLRYGKGEKQKDNLLMLSVPCPFGVYIINSTVIQLFIR